MKTLERILNDTLDMILALRLSERRVRPAALRTIDCMELEERTLLSATPVGTETLVNSTTAGVQQGTPSVHTVAADAAGNYVVVWQSAGQDGDSAAETNIYAQRFDASGTRLGGETLINSTTAGSQSRASVAMDASGNFVVTWTSDGAQDGDGSGVYARRFDTDGTAQGSEFLVNTYTTGDQNSSAVAYDGSGNFIITWSSDGQDGSGWGVYAQRYNSAGATQGSEFLANTETSGDQMYANVAADASGNFLITWSSDVQDGSGFGVYAQRYNSAGATQGTEFQVSTDTADDQKISSAGYDASGNFVIAWRTGTASDGGIRAQVYDAAGTRTSGQIQVNVTTANSQELSDIAVRGDGSFFVSWSSDTQDGSGWGIYAQEFSAAGAYVGSDFLVNTTTLGNQNYSSLALGGDELVIVWSGAGSGDSDGIYFQLYRDNVNDAPVQNLPGPQTVAEDTTLVFSSGGGNQIIVSDSDADGGQLEVTLTATSGTLSLSGTSGLSLTLGDGSGDVSMVFTGSLDDINTALDGLSFVPTAEYSGAASIQISTNDQGNTGTGGARSDTDTVNITVTAVNDGPAVSVPGAQTTAEDTTLLFSSGAGNAISISDIDAGVSPVQVTLTSSSGAMTLSGITGLTFTTGDGTGDSSMVFTGSIASINAALNGLGFTPTGNYSGAASVQIAVNDQGNTGTGGALGDSDTVNITVTAVNDAPVVSVPGAQSTPEDTTLVFSSGGGNQISIADIDAGSNPVEVTLTSSSGAMTLSGIAGLTFTTGDGTGDSSMVFTGTIANINAALNGLGFTPTGNYTGAASLQVAVNDQGNTGTGGALGDSDTVNITVTAVNDAPIVSVPGAQTTAEDTTLVFSSGAGNAISISDIDAGVSPVQVTLTSSGGAMTLSGITGLTFTTGDGTGDSSMVFTGSIANINAALNGLGFTPTGNYIGAASLQVAVNDQGNTGTGGALGDSDTVNIAVTAVNDAPVNVVPVSQNTAEDTPLVFSAGNGNQISISDIDAGTSPLQVTLTVTNGTLTLSGITGLAFSSGDGTGDASMVFTGSITDINAALEGLQFDPTATYSGGAVLQITTDDQGNSGAGGALQDSDNIVITVAAGNDAPINTVPGPQTTSEDSSLVFSSAGGNQISISDIDAAASPVQVTLTATNGLLSLNGTSGLSFTSGTGAGDTTMTFTGTIANVNAALNGLTFAPTGNYNGPASVQIITNDQGNTGAGGALGDSDTVNITVTSVNDAPAGTNTTVSTPEDTPYTFTASDFGFTDSSDSPANALAAVMITTLPGAGTLTNGGVAVVAGQFVTASDISSGLLVFTPVNNANGAGYASFTFQVQDIGGTASGGVDLDPTPNTITVNVTAVNDAPVDTVPGPQTSAEDTPLVFSSAGGNQILVGDLDAGSSLIQVTLTATNGTLTLSGVAGLSFTTGDGTSDASLVFTGTQADINAALDGLRYDPTADYNGGATLTLITDDLGNTGAGGPLTDTDIVNITVSAVNDAPAITLPVAQTTAEDTALVFSTAGGNPIVISDLDAGTNPVRVTLSVTNGTLTLSGVAGLTFSTGDGTADTTMVLTGTIANINAALDGLQYDPTANYHGGASLGVAVDDLGSAGAGGPLTDADSLAITVSSVNDAPVAVEVASGSGLSFDGNDFVTVAAAASLTMTNQVTIEAWINPSGSGGNAIIVNKEGEYEVARFADGTIQWAFANTTPGWTWVSTGYVADANQWTHIAVVYDSGVVNTYANGALVHTYSGTGAIGDIYPAMNDLTIGGRQNATDQRFSGIIDDVRVWNVARSGAEVLATMNSQLVGSESGLVGNWQFDEGRGTVAFDTSLAGNNGQLGGGVAANQPQWVNHVMDEDNTLVISAPGVLANVRDVEGDTLTASLVSGPSNGNLTLNPDGSFTYTPYLNFTGTDSFTFQASDGTTNSNVATVYIVTRGINDAPVNTVPAAQTTAEDTPLVFSAAGGNQIAVTDVDAGSGVVQVTLTVTDGTLSLNGTAGLIFSSGDGTADASMVLTGTITDINAALDGMQFDPTANSSGSAVLQIVTSDLGNAGSGGPLTDSDTVDITVTAVNDAPVNFVSGVSTTEDTPIVFSTANGNAITVTDIDAGAGSLQLTISATNGLVTLGQTLGLTFTSGDGTTDGTMTFTGTLVDINAALEGMRFDPTPDFNGFAVLSIDTNDLGNTGSGGPQSHLSLITIPVAAVNDAPVVTVPSSQTVDEDTALVFSSGAGNAVSVSDIDAGTNPVSIQLLVSSGTLTLSTTTGLVFSSGDGTADGAMQFTGTLAQVNAALDGLRFDPVAGFSGSASLDLVINDQGNSGAGGPQSNTGNVAITISAVNDAPIQSLPGAQTTNEDTGLIFSTAGGNGISIADEDAGVFQLSVTLTATAGRLTLGSTSGLIFVVGSGAGDSTMTFVGTLTNINVALDGLAFMPNQDYNGAANLQVVTSDQGASGSGGPQTDSDTVPITIAAVNDAPQLMLPGSQTTDGSPLVFSSGAGNAIVVSDVDAGSAPVRMILSASQGTVTLSQVTGLTFVSGTGSADAAMEFLGSITDVNAALDGLSYETLGHDGQLDVMAGDEGNTGAGGVQSASGDVAVTLAPPLPPPSSGVDPTDEDTTLPQGAPPPSVQGLMIIPSESHAAERRTSDDRGSRMVAGESGAVNLLLADPDAREQEEVAEAGPAGAMENSVAFVGLQRQQLADMDGLWDQIDRLMNELKQEDVGSQFVIGTVAGFSVLFSAAYVMWCLRGGALVASALSSMPMWRSFDPLPILEFWEKEEKKETDEEEEALDERVLDALGCRS